MRLIPSLLLLLVLTSVITFLFPEQNIAPQISVKKQEEWYGSAKKIYGDGLLTFPEVVFSRRGEGSKNSSWSIHEISQPNFHGLGNIVHVNVTLSRNVTLLGFTDTMSIYYSHEAFFIFPLGDTHTVRIEFRGLPTVNRGLLPTMGETHSGNIRCFSKREKMKFFNLNYDSWTDPYDCQESDFDPSSSVEGRNRLERVIRAISL